MAYPINSLSIQGFRAIEQLELPHFERINLICGPRKGKTAVLQAIHALVVRGRMGVLKGISCVPKMWDLFYHDANTPFSRGNGDPAPRVFGKKFKVIANKADEGHPKLSVSYILADAHRDSMGLLHFKECVGSDDVIGGALVSLKIKTAEHERIKPVLIPPDEDGVVTDSPPPILPVVWLNTANDWRLAEMWTEDFALSDAKEQVKELMWLKNAYIERFMPIGGSEHEPSVFHIRERQPVAMPVDVYGSCVRKLLALGLSLHAAKDGVLLIDDFERDIDSIIMPSVWKGVQLLAREWNVQVFATTRSHECRKAFDHVTEGARKDITIENRACRRMFLRCVE